MLSGDYVQFVSFVYQDQYTFLYTAVRELLLCGDTSVRATDLRRFIAESRKDGFKAQFKVSLKFS